MPATTNEPPVAPTIRSGGRPNRTAQPGRRRSEIVDDGGQTTVLVALVVAMALVLVVAIGRLGAAAVDRAQARTAADAAALAGVIDELRGGGAGQRAATAIAARNGATLTAYDVDGTTVEVTVRVDDAYATSRADRVPATRD